MEGWTCRGFQEEPGGFSTHGRVSWIFIVPFPPLSAGRFSRRAFATYPALSLLGFLFPSTRKIGAPGISLETNNTLVDVSF